MITNNYNNGYNNITTGIFAGRSTHAFASNGHTNQDKIKRKSVVINKIPENDKLNRHVNNARTDLVQNHFKRVVPGNSNYANITSHGKKVCIFGDSIIKRIDMVKFNNSMDEGVAIKRSFPGAVASQFISYIKPTIKDDEPDIVILNIGTNNLSKRNKTQTDVEIMEEM